MDASGIYGKPGAPLELIATDQHGYLLHVSITAWESLGGCAKRVMKDAESVAD